MNNTLKEFGKLLGSKLEQDNPPALARKSNLDSQVGGLNAEHSIHPFEQRGELQSRPAQFEIGQEIPDLHGFRGIDPANQRKYEKYEHRIIAELKAAGRTNQEICEITGYCATSVASIVKLPWVKQFIMDEIHRHGGQAVQDYMTNNAMKAAETVVDGFMDETMERGRDRVAAANSLLDRVFGKANQNITTHKGDDLSKVTDDELARIAQQPQN